MTSAALRLRARSAIVLLGLMALPVMTAWAAPPQTLVAVPERPAAPDLRLDAAEGGTTQLSKLKGRVVVVNFWATWCPPCRREMPSLERLNRAMHGERFAVVGIDAGEEMEDVLRFRTTIDPAPTFDLYLDPDGKALEAFGVKGLPTTYVLDAEGRIAYKALGPREFDDPAIIAAVRALVPK
ncbi:MAG TPA: TlpA disulfide reductase family protein [Usitatibacter sp.]|nr:TlpA disulfide reductase family protein [Usitatibacter sp.]